MSGSQNIYKAYKELVDSLQDKAQLKKAISKVSGYANAECPKNPLSIEEFLQKISDEDVDNIENEIKLYRKAHGFINGKLL